MIRRARYYLETDESSLGTAMHDREERNPVLHELFIDNASEIMAAGSAIYFRHDASTSCTSSPLSFRLFVDPIVSLLVSFFFPHSTLIARGFSLTFLFFFSLDEYSSPLSKSRGFRSAPR